MAQEIADSTLLDTWGSGGNIVEPDISKIIEGWQLGEQPPHEYMNWLQNTFGSKLNHILKNGVVKWNDETEYLSGSSVQHNGNVWLCKTTNTNSEPTDANANWKRIITTVDEINRIGLIDYGYVAKHYHIVAFGGEFNRADYPKLWAYLQANPSLVKTEAQWQTEATANGGICGFFSDGDGTTTFRVPNLDKAFLRPDSRSVASYQEGSYLVGDESGGTPFTNALLNYDENASLFRSRMNWDNLSEVSIGGANLKVSSAGPSSTTSYAGAPSAFGVARPKNIAVLPLIVAK